MAVEKTSMYLLEGVQKVSRKDTVVCTVYTIILSNKFGTKDTAFTTPMLKEAQFDSPASVVVTINMRTQNTHLAEHNTEIVD